MPSHRSGESAEPALRPGVSALRSDVALGCRILGAEEQGDLVWGHVSARDPEGRGVWMKAATLGFDEVREPNVLLVSRDGAVVEGEGRRHAEYPIHTEVIAVRPDVGAVVHTHAPHAVAFAALDVPLRAISHEGTLFVPPDVARFRKTGDLILTAELGADVAGALGDRNALLLVNHGIVAVGPDVPTAVLTAILLDRACRLQLTAMAAGEPRRWSSDEEARSKREHCYSAPLLRQAWDYLARRAG
jgi:ribulose-5-phosphate 4-epimerase/fuculose-1-phosphate aldolase